MNEHFVLKGFDKNVQIVPKVDDLKVILDSFYDFYINNEKLLKGASHFQLFWCDAVDYEPLFELQKKGVYVEIIKKEKHELKELQEHNTMVIKRLVRGGEEIRHDGDIVIDGIVNPDAKIISSGDIYVLGALKGIAHAGCSGDYSKKVVLCNYENAQVRIADMVKTLGKKSKFKGSTMKKAIIMGNEIMLTELI